LSKPRHPRTKTAPPPPKASRLKRALLGGTALTSKPWRQQLGEYLWLLEQGVTLASRGGPIGAAR
jgi:hypothetical protein